MSPRAALESFATRLAAGIPDGTEISVTMNGIPVVVRYALRSAGSSSTKWTEIGVRSQDVVAPPLKFFIDVRATQSSDVSDVRAGRLRDIVLGDPAFDEAFVVEAAPEDVVRVLLDASTRAEILALMPLRVLSSKDFAIEVDREDWIGDVDLLERLASLAARLAGSLGNATNEAADARRRESLVGGYRQGPLTPDDIRREREADLRALDDQRAARHRRDRKIATVVSVVAVSTITVIIVVIAVLSSC